MPAPEALAREIDQLLALARRHALMRRFDASWRCLAQCQELLKQAQAPRQSGTLRCQALALKLRALSASEVPTDCITEAQRLDEVCLDQEPAVRFEVSLSLAEVFGQIGLMEPALSAFEQASSWAAQLDNPGHAVVEVDLGMANVLLRSGLQQEAIERLTRWTEQLLPADLSLQVHSLLGSAHYFLAEAGGPDTSAHRDASLFHHSRSARDALMADGAFGRYRCAINLAIGHARRGDVDEARQLLAQIEAMRDEVWAAAPTASESRVRLEHGHWTGFIRAVIALAEQQLEQAIQELQVLLSELRDAHLGSYMGLLQLRAAELLVNTAQEAGRFELAFYALRELQGLQARRHRVREDLSSRLLADALAASRLRLQNTSLIQQGSALERSLAQRHQELTQTLDQLRTEVAIRQATEAALQQAHDELEQRVEQRTSDLHQTLQALAHQERLAAMSHMVVGIGHELNTPLGNALLALSTQADATTDLKRRLDGGQLKRSDLLEFLALLGNSSELARHSLQRAADLVLRFKELSVQQVPEPRLRFNPVQQVEQALQRWRSACGALQIDLDSSLAPCSQAEGYPGALVRILDQLIDNALSHAFEPGTPGALIHVRLVQEGDSLELRVRDNGRGVALEQHEEIFSPFMTSARSRGHAGLGLHVAHVLAQQMLGGQLRAEAAWPQGLCMVLRFPREAPQQAQAALSPAPTGATVPSPAP